VGGGVGVRYLNAEEEEEEEEEEAEGLLGGVLFLGDRVAEGEMEGGGVGVLIRDCVLD